MSANNQTWFDIGTILNMLSIRFEQQEIDATPNIRNIHISAHKTPVALAFLKQKGTTLTPNTRPFDNLLSCQEPGAHMVLIVAQANPHEHEAGQVDIPEGKPYVVYMLFFAGKHIITCIWGNSSNTKNTVNIETMSSKHLASS